MWTMWDAPSDLDYYDQFGLWEAYDEEPEDADTEPCDLRNQCTQDQEENDECPF